MVYIYPFLFGFFSHKGYNAALSRFPCAIYHIFATYLFCIYNVNPSLLIHPSPSCFLFGNHKFWFQNLFFRCWFFKKLLSKFYYTYSCTTIITTQFYGISIPNPRNIPPPPDPPPFGTASFSKSGGPCLFF